MTPEEKQEIVQAVIAALKTNGRTIMQLTEATSISNSDFFEIHGGRRIAYSKLYNNIMDDLSDTIENFETDVNTALAGKVNGYLAFLIADDTHQLALVFHLIAADTFSKRYFSLCHMDSPNYSVSLSSSSSSPQKPDSGRISIL